MKLSTKGRYAVTAMLDLALHSGSGPISLSEISGRQDISLSYLEQLFSKLRKANLVDSIRGPGGGYELQRPSNRITIVDVVLAVDEPIDATRCKGKGGCQDGEHCLSHQLWAELSDQIYQFLSGISLEQVVERRFVKKVAGRQDAANEMKISEEELIFLS
ncbi:Rrf2 family transcriptional regulator [Kangiella sp. HZ709]|uniref:Rrf2 family transcriptional regulator n=1 Tax=Kangiella sp. HZ709 TaxID=2666328 RepID=UPI0012AF3071|nr:Rrf2 family transcriptional regulator [Kangiella sp. HZ709]MRX26725.1 Rrf2 family transcriptional regulator [Kangiella sp. HZ709]